MINDCHLPTAEQILLRNTPTLQDGNAYGLKEAVTYLRKVDVLPLSQRLTIDLNGGLTKPEVRRTVQSRWPTPGTARIARKNSK